MKIIKRILFLFLLFLFGVFGFWFMHETRVFNDIQLLFFVGAMLGVLVMLIGYLFITDRKDDDTDIIVKIKKDEDE